MTYTNGIRDAWKPSYYPQRFRLYRELDPAGKHTKLVPVYNKDGSIGYVLQ